MLRSSIILLSLSAVCLGQYAPTRSAAPTENIPAWYQMSKPAAAPAYPYERRDTYERLDRQPIAQHTNTYAGYPAYPTNRGSSYPDTVPASMASSISALGSPQRRYPPVSSSSTTDPNSELLAAIKDVVAKFKASLDETGIDQDVRLMGNQLRNTWQQLRTGVDRGVKAVKQSAEQSVREMNYGPMNEQIGRLFEKAADATDLRSIRN